MKIERLFLSVILLSASSALAGGINVTGTPTHLLTAPEGYYFSVVGAPAVGCTNGDYVISNSHPNFKLAAASILTAFVTGKQINVISDGTCFNGRPNIVYVIFP